MEPRSPALQADSLPAEPQGNTKNTGVGSLSLLQGDPGIELRSPILQADSLPTELSRKPLNRRDSINTVIGFFHAPQPTGTTNVC